MKLLTKEERKEKRVLACGILKSRRLDLGLTLTEAAEKFGLSESSMQRHENGKAAISLDIFLALCEFYNINTDLGYEKSKV